jgi:hypothetical protein
MISIRSIRRCALSHSIQSLITRTFLFPRKAAISQPVLSESTSVKSHNLKLILARVGALEHVQDVAPPGEVVNLLSGKTTLLQQALQPGDLLLNVARVLLALLGDLAVVLGVLVLGAADGLLELLLGLSTAGAQSADDRVERGDGTGNSIESTACNTESTGLVVQEGDEVGLAATAGVGDSLGGAGRVVLDGRVGLDAGGLGDGFGVRGLAVDFGDEDLGFGGEVVGDLLPNGGKGLAVWKGRC